MGEKHLIKIMELKNTNTALKKNSLKWFKNKLYAAEHKIRKLKDNSLRVI